MNTARTASWPLPGNPHATVGTRHHLLPQLHQRYFGNDQKMIAAVDRATGRRYVAPISDTATERDFYTSLDESGAKDGRSDHLIGKIEKDAAPVIRELVTAGAFARFPPPAEAREAMCWFLAFQKIRGRASRKKTELLGDAFMHVMIPKDMSADDAESWLRARGHEPTPEAVEQVLALSACVDETEFVPDPNAHIAMIAPLALKIFEELVLRRWYVAEYAAPSLLTCDEPVVLVFDEHRPQYRGVGLMDAVEVWFPLSPRHLLVLTKDDRYGTQRRACADPASARDVNLRILPMPMNRSSCTRTMTIWLASICPSPAPCSRSSRPVSRCWSATTSGQLAPKHSGGRGTVMSSDFCSDVSLISSRREKLLLI